MSDEHERDGGEQGPDRRPDGTRSDRDTGEAGSAPAAQQRESGRDTTA